MPLVVIGKVGIPGCFKNVKIQDLPVDYRFNKKAWSKTEINETILNEINQNMKKSLTSYSIIL